MNYSHPYLARIDRILKEQGDLYGFSDILEYLDTGAMQSFTVGESLVVTRVSEFPRRRVLDIVLAVGKLEEIYQIQPQVVAFAREHNCEMLMASVGRDGWFDAKTPGWERVASTYIRRL